MGWKAVSVALGAKASGAARSGTAGASEQRPSTEHLDGEYLGLFTADKT